MTPVNVLYEEDGAFKVGTVITESEASLQVEAPHGKRAKLKARQVLLRFDRPPAGQLMEQADALAASIDVDFLWECCGADEFDFQELAQEYFGRMPAPVEAAAILIKLHGAPVHFHRKGRGRYRAAPAETLRAALAGMERRRQQALKIEAWAEALARGELPEELRPRLDELLYRPDRNQPEVKALERAAEAAGLSPAKLLERAGALPPSHEYHVQRFLAEHFPGGDGFPAGLEPHDPEGLPRAPVAAFSLDDESTTEIDDAFSIVELPDGRLRVGIHIAAPGLGFAPDSPLGLLARRRLSTVYSPGRKITMLPPCVIERYTLAAGRDCPAVSLYVEVDPDLNIANRHTAIERVPIAANLRHQDLSGLDALFLSGESPAAGGHAAQLHTLWRLAVALEKSRGKASMQFERPEYVFRVDDDRVAITERRRGMPLDKLVAELMILANSTWGKLLDEHNVAAIYRVKHEGRVRMTTSAAAHQGLGTTHYAWSTSPLRRYVDLVNQWQLIALLGGRQAPFGRSSDLMLSALHDFETTYAAYDDFQARMERYWCLRWLQQEGVTIAPAVVVRENLVRFERLPLHVKMPSLPPTPPGTRIEVAVTGIDLVETTLECRYLRAPSG